MSVVSVIVPVYNTEKWVGNCIESILNQTFTDFELLLIDDGSQDHSREICELYAQKDKRVRVIHQANGGVSKARNLGIAFSSGQYISFVDSDDQIEIDFLQRAIDKCMEKHAEIYMSGVRGIENGIEVAKGVVNNSVFLNACKLTKKQRIELLEQNYTASCNSKLFLKEKIGKTRFEENCVFGEDLMFVHELLKKNVTVFADTYIGYNYFKRSGSLITTISSKKCEDIIKTYLYLLKTPVEFNCTENEYSNYLKQRCISDLNLTQKSILEGNTSIKDKYERLKILFSQEEILQILKEDIGKTRLGKYSFKPSIVLLRHYRQKIKKGYKVCLAV